MCETSCDSKQFLMHHAGAVTDICYDTNSASTSTCQFVSCELVGAAIVVTVISAFLSAISLLSRRRHQRRWWHRINIVIFVVCCCIFYSLFRAYSSFQCLLFWLLSLVTTCSCMYNDYGCHRYCSSSLLAFVGGNQRQALARLPLLFTV